MSLTRSFVSWLATRRAFTRAVGRTGMRLGFARRFIAGETLEEALRVAAELNARGLEVIMNQLGENIRDTADAESSCAAYLEILRRLAARRIDGTITIKPTQLALELDPALCQELSRRVVRQAEALGSFVEIDMEHSSAADATLALFERVRSEHANVGIALQAYLYRTESDLRRLERHRPKIRLVKGAYLEPPDVAFPEKRRVDENYRKLLRILFSGAFTPAVATHDEAMLDEAKSLAREHGRGPGEWEVQMLFGVRRDLQDALAREGIQVRVYTTFGTDWVPYFMRRLVERPANLTFVLRSIFRGG